MKLFSNYKIDFARRHISEGTHENPFLIDITSGERTLDSLIFFIKINKSYNDSGWKIILKKTRFLRFFMVIYHYILTHNVGNV